MAGLTLWSASPAEAAAVTEHGTFEISESFDDAEYCADWGLTLHVELTNSGTFNIMNDVDGNWRFATVSQSLGQREDPGGRRPVVDRVLSRRQLEDERCAHPNQGRRRF